MNIGWEQLPPTKPWGDAALGGGCHWREEKDGQRTFAASRLVMVNNVFKPRAGRASSRQTRTRVNVSSLFFLVCLWFALRHSFSDHISSPFSSDNTNSAPQLYVYDFMKELNNYVYVSRVISSRRNRLILSLNLFCISKSGNSTAIIIYSILRHHGFLSNSFS